jgi:hypothetical protein
VGPLVLRPAAALTHYLLLGPPEARRSFEELRRRLQDGAIDETGASVFGDPGALQRALDAYVEGNTFSSYSASMSIEQPEDLVVRPRPPAEALAVRGDFLVQTGHEAALRSEDPDGRGESPAGRLKPPQDPCAVRHGVDVRAAGCRSRRRK